MTKTFIGLVLVILATLTPSQAQTVTQPPPRSVAFSDTGGANSNTPNLPAQTIGPNDLLSVSVYDAPEFTRTIRVTADGNVALPLMKRPIPAAGLLPAELEIRLTEALRDQNLLNDATVVVTVAEYNSHPVTVNGSVRSPLTFQIVGHVRLMDAITRAGGLSPDAGPEALISEQNNDKPGLVRRILLKPLLDSSDPDLNIELTGGQEVRIPAAGKIFILGNVKSAGAFPIQDEADTTVLKSITLAGGLAGPAPKEAFIVRQEDGMTKRQIPIPLKAMLELNSPDVRMMAHDILYVPNNKRRDTLDNLSRILAYGAAGALIVSVAAR